MIHKVLKNVEKSLTKHIIFYNLWQFKLTHIYKFNHFYYKRNKKNGFIDH